jgi:rod shape-determining protein MreD
MSLQNRPTAGWTLMIFLIFGQAAIFLQARFTLVRDALGVQIDLVPALVVYAAARFDVTTAVVAVAAVGLLMDALSANPLGVSLLAYTIVCGITLYFRELLLPESRTAQVLLGAAATAACEAVAVLILFLAGTQPLLGAGSIYHLLLVSGVGGLMTTVWFWLFEALDDALRYKEMPESSFRADREIARGRR